MGLKELHWDIIIPHIGTLEEYIGIKILESDLF